jgi:hypothetical protein
MLEPLDPDTTIAFRLLYSVRDFFAEPPVLSRASFRMRFTCEKSHGNFLTLPCQLHENKLVNILFICSLFNNE